jgi:hypothetical protein
MKVSICVSVLLKSAIVASPHAGTVFAFSTLALAPVERSLPVHLL